MGGWSWDLGSDERCQGQGRRGGCGRVERGEPMGWRRGRGRSWSGPRAFRTALAGGRGGGLEPEALGRPQ